MHHLEVKTAKWGGFNGLFAAVLELLILLHSLYLAQARHSLDLFIFFQPIFFTFLWQLPWLKVSVQLCEPLWGQEQMSR